VSGLIDRTADALARAEAMLDAYPEDVFRPLDDTVAYVMMSNGQMRTVDAVAAHTMRVVALPMIELLARLLREAAGTAERATRAEQALAELGKRIEDQARARIGELEEPPTPYRTIPESSLRRAYRRRSSELERELELTRAILARILTTGEAAVYTAADGSRFLGLHYSTVDLTAAQAAYLEELDR
jgi:hypothetical protein